MLSSTESISLCSDPFLSLKDFKAYLNRDKCKRYHFESNQSNSYELVRRDLEMKALPVQIVKKCGNRKVGIGGSSILLGTRITSIFLN